MKIGPRDTGTFLKSPDSQAKAVLLYGPDSGLVRERSKIIATAILGPDSDPFNRVELSNEILKSDPARLRDELSALSLMGGRRLVVIRDAGEKIGALIATAFEGLDTTTYLIAEAEELAPATNLRSTFEKNEDFAALACYREEGRNLEELIRSTLAGLGMHTSRDALQYLVANLGNDRGVTISELEKIALYMGTEKDITLDIAMQLTGHNSSESIEDMCHAVALGKTSEAHALLMKLLHEGAQAVTIIRSLLKHFQKLDIAQAHIDAGESVDQAIAALRPPVFFKYIPMVKRELSGTNTRIISYILNLLLRAEKDLKSSLLSAPLLASQTIQQAARLVG